MAVEEPEEAQRLSSHFSFSSDFDIFPRIFTMLILLITERSVIGNVCLHPRSANNHQSAHSIMSTKTLQTYCQFNSSLYLREGLNADFISPHPSCQEVMIGRAFDYRQLLCRREITTDILTTSAQAKDRKTQYGQRSACNAYKCVAFFCNVSFSLLCFMLFVSFVYSTQPLCLSAQQI